MKKWKYYGLNDSKQEALGILYAESIEEAYDIASRMKQLPLPEFKKLFGVERL